MTTSVVCISRTLAAGGEEVGRIVAQSLGFQYADEEILDQTAERAGVSREAVAKAERPPGLVARIVEGLAITSVVPTESGAWSGMPLSVSPAPAGYDELIQDVIRERAQQGSVVIVAHGGSACLRNTPNVLRVLVTAPAAARADRLSRSRGITPAEAKKAVDASDRQRKQYLDRFYHVEEQPTDYDLVVNTDVIGIERSAEIVVRAAAH
ncbi:MAG TPA: cytidylate kinase-like family protein [Dehalococcoidia bacterium]|nr:cytidylate kinase-like family protein [Dehalococcoidia bacterium]